jgi:hypothetical protein
LFAENYRSAKRDDRLDGDLYVSTREKNIAVDKKIAICIYRIVEMYHKQSGFPMMHSIEDMIRKRPWFMAEERNRQPTVQQSLAMYKERAAIYQFALVALIQACPSLRADYERVLATTDYEERDNVKTIPVAVHKGFAF